MIAAVSDCRLMAKHFIGESLSPQLNQRDGRPNIFMSLKRPPVCFFECLCFLRFVGLHAQRVRGKHAVKAFIETGCGLQFALHLFRLAAFQVRSSTPVQSGGLQVDVCSGPTDFLKCAAG